MASGPKAQIDRAANKSQSYFVWKNSPNRLLFQLMETTSFSISSARKEIKLYYLWHLEFFDLNIFGHNGHNCHFQYLAIINTLVRGYEGKLINGNHAKLYWPEPTRPKDSKNLTLSCVEIYTGILFWSLEATRMTFLRSICGRFENF